VSADTIADVNLDADELDSIQKSKLQQFFGIADSEVSVRFVRRSHFVFSFLFGVVSLHEMEISIGIYLSFVICTASSCVPSPRACALQYFHKYRKLIKIYGPDVVMSLTSIASATVSKSVEAIVKKRASVVGGLGGALPLGVPESSPDADEDDDDAGSAHGLASSSSSSAAAGRKARISVDSKLHRFYGMDEESKRMFEKQQDAVLRILRRLGEAPDLHELDEWMDEARKLKAAQTGQGQQ
jgi:hypothetical protein